MYLYFEATAALYVVTLFALMLFAAGVLVSVILWRKGQAKSLYRKANMSSILKSFILNVVLQVQIIKFSFVRWLMHMCIFIGFMGLLAETSWLAILSHFVPPNSALAQSFFELRGKLLLDVWGDIFGVIILLGLVIALFRRYILRVEQLDTIAKDTVSLVLLLIIVLSGFLCEAFRIMQSPGIPHLTYSFGGLLIAKILNALGLSALNYKLCVWIHALISLFFIAYIPFSKMWHAFVSPIEILLDASQKA